MIILGNLFPLLFFIMMIVWMTRSIGGGAGGGSAALTPAGEYLLDQFAAYEQAIKRYAQQQLQQFFPIEEQEGEQT